MDRVDGHVPVQWKPDDPIAFGSQDARRAIGLDFVDALASIHGLDWRAVGLGGPRDEVAHWERLLDEAVLVEVPLVREAIVWLRANPASSGRVALVHGDYRIGNFILGSDRRIAAVLDWELAHVGDPVEDIAWAGSAVPWPLLAVVASSCRRRSSWSATRSARGWWSRRRCCGTHCAVHAADDRALPTGLPRVEDGRSTDLRLAAMGHQAVHLYRHLATELRRDPELAGAAAW